MFLWLLGLPKHEAVCQGELICFSVTCKIIMYRYNCSMQEQHRGGRVSSLRCFEDLAGQSWQTRSSESDRLPWSDGLDWRPPKVPFEQCFRNCKCHYGARTRYKRLIPEMNRYQKSPYNRELCCWYQTADKQWTVQTGGLKVRKPK